MRTIEVVPFSSLWSSDFQAEARLIAQALGETIVRLHHIGSTSIPGIFAKPIIDVLLEVDGVEELDEKSSALEDLGYEAMGEFGIPGRRYFRKEDESGTRTHHIHAFKQNSSGIKRHLAFRDYMIAHPDVAHEYSELKQRLAKEHPHDIEAYMDGKDPFIKEHQEMALARQDSEGSTFHG